MRRRASPVTEISVSTAEVSVTGMKTFMTSKAVGDDTKVSDVDKSEDGDSTESSRQRRRNNTLAVQATSEAADDGAKVSDVAKGEGDSTERQRTRNITLAGQAARDEYIARLKERLTKTAGESDTDKEDWLLNTKAKLKQVRNYIMKNANWTP